MKHQRSPLVIKSFAKLNLYLQVLNKRRDNFHNLNTLFSRIDLADTLILKEREGNSIKIKCNSRQVPKGKTNLCWQAAALLKKEYNLKHGLEIEIKKCIPVGAGLGGGSSNAASVLLGLGRYWKLNLPKTKLLNLAAKIGSDVPFFICDTKFALGSNRGDKIKPLTSLQQLKLWFILIYPNIKVSTPLIYRKFDCFSGLTIPRHDVKILTSELSKKGFRIKQEYLFNSLEAVTSGLYPVVNQVKNALYGMGLEKVIMSGSGPAVFAICSSLKQAQAMSGKLRKQYKSWQIFVSSTA
ncbi:MAG: 4-(cytidine 5'-diphospho)-2-C-methyl-D-erythritol kinase [Candidatus Omnitrophota bacterium]|nr:4-(cytidine 5'-diphospho)-2-C-methyl-D-erythritol kinase [Candidatus Omnitrophota bacterium]